MPSIPLVLLLPVLLLLACGDNDAPSPPPLPPDQQSYIDAQEALAADDADAARTALKRLQQNAAAPLKEKAAAAAAAADILAMRTAFHAVSEIVTRGPIPAGHVLAYCPMAEENTGGYWIQKEGDIANPYFGASMLRCGGYRDQRADAKP